MRSKALPPVYSQVAYDIAMKIAKGTLKENSRFSGRSLMSSEYGVSQETIRRALKQLADLEIIDIHQASGVVVISQAKAASYIEKFQASKDVRSLKAQLKQLISQRQELDAKIYSLMDQIVDLNERFVNSDPLKNFELELAPDSRLIGKTIGQSEFRQKTKATIVAIKNQDQINLSPSPDTVFKANDVLVVAGQPSTLDMLKEFIK